MKKETKKAPTIRFRGFTDDWEQRKFDEIASRESSTGISSEILPSVEYEDVISGVGQLNKDIAEKAVHKKGIKFDKIHVLYGKLRPYLHNWINPRFKGIAVGDWWVLKPVATDKDFLYRLVQTKQFDDIANLSTGSKMPRADWNLVSKSEFMIPGELKEQHLIGQCFSNLDKLITLHQRKLDQLKKLQKYFLQNMFPAKGEKVPRIRFKGFTGDWECCKLGDIMKSSNTKTDDFESNPLYSLTIEDGITPKTDRYERGYLVQKEESIFKIVRPNEFVTNPMNLRLGAFGYNKNGFTVSVSGYYDVFSIDKNKCSSFWNAYFNYPETLHKFDVIATGTLIEKRRVTYSSLSKLSLLTPTDIKEKQKIGRAYRKLEDCIVLQQQKISQLQTMKKFMLQNLFI